MEGEDESVKDEDESVKDGQRKRRGRKRKRRGKNKDHDDERGNAFKGKKKKRSKGKKKKKSKGKKKKKIKGKKEKKSNGKGGGSGLKIPDLGGFLPKLNGIFNGGGERGNEEDITNY